MSDISTRWSGDKRLIKRRNINYYLLVLGAKPEEVYLSNNRIHSPNQVGYLNVYTRHGPFLLGWIESLYRASMRRFHPDRTLENKQAFEQKAKEVTEAYREATRIVRNYFGQKERFKEMKK